MIKRSTTPIIKNNHQSKSTINLKLNNPININKNIQKDIKKLPINIKDK
jgi:hypothetical protein